MECDTPRVGGAPAIGQVLSPQPLLRIGEADGVSRETFGRIAGVVALSSGGIAVADGSNQLVVLFNSEGQRIGTVGRSGSGPGEFRLIQSIRRCWGDSLAVYDPALRRISVFGGMGELGRTIDLAQRQPGQRPYDVWCGDGGRLVLLHRVMTETPPAGVGPYRPSAVLLVLRSNDVVVRLDTTFASEKYFSGHEDFPRPLGRRTSIATAGAVAFVMTDRLSSSDSLGIEVYDLISGLVRHLRIPCWVLQHPAGLSPGSQPEASPRTLSDRVWGPGRRHG